MSYFFFILRTSIEDFKRNKVRTLLTSLGILIGVSSVILLIAMGLGLKRFIQNQFESLGTNLLIVMPGQLLQGGGSFGAPSISGLRFDEKDVLTLKRVKNAEYVVPAFLKVVTASANGNSEVGDVYATTEDIFPMRNLGIEYGDYFTKGDIDKRSKKVVLGPKIAEKLFDLPEKALNKTIKIEKQGYKVVGVLESKGGGGFGGPDFDSFIYIPYKSVLSLNPDKTFYNISLKAENSIYIEQIKDDVKSLLSKRYDEDDFSVVEMTDIQDAVSSIFSILNAVLIAIAAISLLVGGIGIMNIMYVSVMERVKEIGIRRAIGATDKDILFQFLTEAVILSLLGGTFGLGVSFIIVYLIQSIFPAYIDSTSVLAALGVSSIIGIVFGVFPARRASKLTPIEAIRYE